VNVISIIFITTLLLQLYPRVERHEVSPCYGNSTTAADGDEN